LNNSAEGINGPKCLLAYVPKFDRNLIGWSEFGGLIEAITIDGTIYHSILVVIFIMMLVMQLRLKNS